MAGTQGQVTFRIYFTETSGAVLGANFMSGKNVIFDPPGESICLSVCLCLSVRSICPHCLSVCPHGRAGGRVGFAQSSCRFEDLTGVADITSNKIHPHTRPLAHLAAASPATLRHQQVSQATILEVLCHLRLCA